MIDVANFFQKNNILFKKSTFLLALSGGVDSVVLFHLCCDLRINFQVAHCNFKLRGVDSDDDEQFVLDLCRSYGIQCHTISFETSRIAEEQNETIQVTARNLRYKWFEELMARGKLDYLLTAHHAGDNIETVIYNLTKGTRTAGLRGVAGIKDTLLRPLINYSKKEILAYAKDNKIKWREDKSNTQNKYSRNLIRNEVIPLLERINPSIQNTVTSFTEYSRDLHQFLHNQINEYLHKYLHNNRYEIPKKSLSDFDNQFLFDEVLFQFGFTADQRSKIISSEFELSGKLFESDNYQLVYDRDRFIFQKKGESNLQEFAVDDYGEYHLDKMQFKFELLSDFSFDELSTTTVFINTQAIKFPLTIRPWRDGDVFKPFGMKGKKKISDFLIDNKVDVLRKKDVLVLASDNNILWVIGYRLSELCRVGEYDKQVCKVSYRDNLVL